MITHITANTTFSLTDDWSSNFKVEVLFWLQEIPLFNGCFIILHINKTINSQHPNA